MNLEDRKSLKLQMQKDMSFAIAICRDVCLAHVMWFQQHVVFASLMACSHKVAPATCRIILAVLIMAE